MAGRSRQDMELNSNMLSNFRTIDSGIMKLREEAKGKKELETKLEMEVLEKLRLEKECEKLKELASRLRQEKQNQLAELQKKLQAKLEIEVSEKLRLEKKCESLRKLRAELEIEVSEKLRTLEKKCESLRKLSSNNLQLYELMNKENIYLKGKISMLESEKKSLEKIKDSDEKKDAIVNNQTTTAKTYSEDTVLEIIESDDEWAIIKSDDDWATLNLPDE